MGAAEQRDVVVVGGGPTGMMLAAELALAGADVAVVERRAGVELDGSRARGLHARTIEVLDQRGVADRFLAEGQAMQVAGFSFIPLDISDFPARHHYGLALMQADFERILAGWVGELGVPYVRGVVAGVAQDADGVDVSLEDGRTVRAGYVVGCDGGRSVVRKAAGIAFEGWDPSVSYLIAELHVGEEPPAWGIRRDALGVNAIGPAGEGLAGVVLSRPYTGPAVGEPTFEELRAALADAYGTDFGLHSPRWISRFTDMTRQAATYRAGRVLVAGDAAHVHSPSGGQGLNLGVQDAVNLGWKLGLVVRGAAPEALLDTYGAERGPVAARVLRATMAQTALGRGDDRTEALREIVTDLLGMDAPRRHLGAVMSGLDVHYDLGGGHPLVGRRMPDLDLTLDDGSATRVYALLHAARPVLVSFDGRAREAGAWADQVRVVSARTDGPWELPVLGAVDAPPAVLVRPDGHVAWAGDDDGLVEALTRWCGDRQPG